MEHPILYRKRLIPNECILLKDDEIIYQDSAHIITKWNTLKPRPDFHHGYSCYYLEDGIKISRFYKEDNTFVYWYCDIVAYEKMSDTNAICITDLLADVVILPDAQVKVLDIDELCDAKERGLLQENEFFSSVRHLGMLLKMIENKQFEKYAEILLEHIY